MRLRLVREAFDHAGYIFELKHEGFRAVAYLQNGDCKLISRNLKNLRFQSLRGALAELPVQSAIIDGEIVCVDEKGVSRFNQLLSDKGEPIFYAFDLRAAAEALYRRAACVPAAQKRESAESSMRTEEAA